MEDNNTGLGYGDTYHNFYRSPFDIPRRWFEGVDIEDGDLKTVGKPLITRNNQDVKDAQQFEIAKEILKWFLREDTRIDRAVKRSIHWSKEFMKQLNEE